MLLCLQITSSSAFPPLDLRGLPQLTDLGLWGYEDEEIIFRATFPAQLRSLNVELATLDFASWRSLGRCLHLQKLSCEIEELPPVAAEALPRLQELVLVVHCTELVSWAASVAARSDKACLDIRDDPSPLLHAKFHGLQLEKLELTENAESTAGLLQNLRVRDLSARFLGSRISKRGLPQDLVKCRMSTTAQCGSMVVDLLDCASLEEFSLRVPIKCQLELHGSFREEHFGDWRSVQWLGSKRCKAA